MARSTETFNKKEKEKKKAKKLQDKREKAEERKANSSKGKGLDEMMAYVDEYGNITSTPPDPTKKKAVINTDDIQISVARQEHVEEEKVRKGVITHFNDAKGYGFIRDTASQESIFVHINAAKEPLKEGDKVEFETEQGQKGLNAVNVKLVK